jgi:peptidoglycan-N-acetylglucosamine deacetylase
MNILSFDIEDWFNTHQNRNQHSGDIWDYFPSRVKLNTQIILSTLNELNCKATFFILGWVAKKHPDVVKSIYDQGHEIGAHSYWHHNPNRLHATDFNKDLKLCLSVLSDITGDKVLAYRAPAFSLRMKDQWAFEILADNGIEIDSSVKVRDSSQTLPYIIRTRSSQILEFPLLTTSYLLPYTGGGYFRVLPKRFIQLLFKKEQYRLLYFHPHDFNPNKTYTNLFSPFRNWLNNYNTGSCMDQLKIILQEKPTISIGDAVKYYKE